MKSTGEVMGLGETAEEALGKALIAAGSGLPAPGAAVLFSLAERDKDEAMPLIRRLAALGYDLVATEGTAERIREELGLPVESVTKKLNEGHPNVLDVTRPIRLPRLPGGAMARPAHDGWNAEGHHHEDQCRGEPRAARPYVVAKLSLQGIDRGGRNFGDSGR